MVILEKRPPPISHIVHIILRRSKNDNFWSSLQSQRPKQAANSCESRSAVSRRRVAGTEDQLSRAFAPRGRCHPTHDNGPSQLDHCDQWSNKQQPSRTVSPTCNLLPIATLRLGNLNRHNLLAIAYVQTVAIKAGRRPGATVKQLRFRVHSDVLRCHRGEH